MNTTIELGAPASPNGKIERSALESTSRVGDKFENLDLGTWPQRHFGLDSLSLTETLQRITPHQQWGLNE